MNGAAFKDHFSGHSAEYAASRPTYPPELAVLLAEYTPGRELALDCGCGNGQLSVLLAAHFDAVIATDASEQQIAAAETHPKVSYRAVPAEASGLADQSVDLVTVAQAAHWFDLDAFYAEVRRVAKPNALLTLITYAHMTCNGAEMPAVTHFYANVVGPYWPPERKFVEERYRSLAFPFEEIELPTLNIELEWSRQQLLDYIGTWSAVRRAQKDLGPEPMQTLASELARSWPDEEIRLIQWPLTIRAGRCAG